MSSAELARRPDDEMKTLDQLLTYRQRPADLAMPADGVGGSVPASFIGAKFLGRVMARSRDRARRLLRFLSTHPTRRGGVNWAIWAGVLVVIIAIGSANSTPNTSPAASSDVPTASLSAGGGRAAITTRTSAQARTTPPARRARTTRVAVGGDVIRAGAVLPNRARRPEELMSDEAVP